MSQVLVLNNFLSIAFTLNCRMPSGEKSMMTIRMAPKTASSSDQKYPRSDRKFRTALMMSVPQRLDMPPTATMAT